MRFLSPRIGAANNISPSLSFSDQCSVQLQCVKGVIQVLFQTEFEGNSDGKVKRETLTPLEQWLPTFISSRTLKQEKVKLTCT
jgi:hypothetical protein